MKKIFYIVAPILLAVILATAGVLLWVINSLQNSQPPEVQVPYNEVTVYDSQGAELLRTKEPADVYQQEYWAYLETVFAEVAEIVAEQKQLSREDALEWFFQQGGEIHTTFDRIAFTALKEVELVWGKTCNTAGAITDLNGNLLAVYCTDINGKQINYTQDRRSPYSSFKALSVYTPAVEKGLVNWSTMYADTPYKQLTEENATVRDWPANASGTYSQDGIYGLNTCFFIYFPSFVRYLYDNQSTVSIISYMKYVVYRKVKQLANLNMTVSTITLKKINLILKFYHYAKIYYYFSTFDIITSALSILSFPNKENRCSEQRKFCSKRNEKIIEGRWCNYSRGNIEGWNSAWFAKQEKGRNLMASTLLLFSY